jgi:hypothetical protein
VIRLLVAAVVCLALHPAATGAACARERAIVAAVAGDQVAAPSLDGHFDGVMAASAAVLAHGSWSAAPVVALRSVRVVARLWLRGQRLLC